MKHAALLLACAAPLLAAEPTLHLQPADDGVHVQAGSLGSFTLTYPEIFSDSSGAHKLVEKRHGATEATLRYEDGTRAEVTIVSGREVRVKFSDLPADVKKSAMNILIDPAYARGGTWQIGATTGTFPRAKPAKPHLFQGNAGRFELTDAQGRRLAIATLAWAYHELVDNREWNWNIFNWKVHLPIQNGATLALAFEVANTATGVVRLIDDFGQPIKEDFADKVRSVDELKADIAKQDAYFGALKNPPTDPYGGLPGSGAKLGLKKTSFFHVEAKEAKTWLVDPDGNAFFHLGVCVFGPGDDYTYVQGRESIYTWLPPFDGEFRSAFRENDRNVLSFHLANQIRKFGAPYDPETYVGRMIDRVRALGFNSIGAFSGAPERVVREKTFPYVAHLPLDEWKGVPHLPGVFAAFDPFDDATRARIEKNFAEELPGRATDPLLIGWFVANEPRFDEIPKNVPGLTGKHAAKRKLVTMLREKYGTIEKFNAAWDAKAGTFDELNDQGLAAKTDAARADLKAYTGLFLDTYFSFVTGVARRHDPHHLILGARYQPVTIDDEQLCRITGKYCDIMSYNYYTTGIDRDQLRRVHAWSGRPLMLSEFFWSSPPDSGLAGGREVKTQRERGLAYRNYVEQSAALGFVVGIEWFTLVDQSATGRWFSKYNGEGANTGLFSVGDRPWKDAVERMRETNIGLYDVLTGTRAAFEWDDPRFTNRGIPVVAPP